MQLTTVPLSALLPPKGNPRRTLDNTQVATLARSIAVDGLLQNLVVRREGDETFRVVSGKRLCNDNCDGRSYCLTGECYRASEHCLTTPAPVASLLSPDRAPRSPFLSSI